MRQVKLLVLIAILMTVFSILYYGLNNGKTELNNSMMNEPVPSFRLSSLSEDKILDESLFVGEQHTLLNVWASWCAACKIEHPFLVELSVSGIDIVGLNYRDVRQDAKKVIAQDGNPYSEIVFDPNGELALDLGVLGAPETFVIDNKGMILKRVSGVIDAEVWENQLVTYFQP
ncbi:DsbE family thiol:disulfide interchange protein [Vibrio algarum]|uniref:DsbE family thiol:disulfide interchange protein n=1 Tax=Vibrio algarum TaxID=3020714 RepID=A0ABT4YQC3_9VIBR|nr:DsbE family thiol:disulfide interchange protein [Vibrio sp. KJ40-1]MDB1123759.1 DsbE family thiol:disulfide interchange protein [Vibrio sp. KJ40-1]